jgi:hypothetical protein
MDAPSGKSRLNETPNRTILLKFELNQKVSINGLNSKPELNGQKGTVTGYNATNQRFAINVGSSTFGIKATNLSKEDIKTNTFRKIPGGKISLSDVKSIENEYKSYSTEDSTKLKVTFSFAVTGVFNCFFDLMLAKDTRPNNSVIELSAGKGLLKILLDTTQMFRDLELDYHQTVGFPEMIRRAEELGSSVEKTMVCPIQSLPDNYENASGIVSLDLLNSCNREDLQVIALSTFKTLAPGGQFGHMIFFRPDSKIFLDILLLRKTGETAAPYIDEHGERGIQFLQGTPSSVKPISPKKWIELIDSGTSEFESLAKMTALRVNSNCKQRTIIAQAYFNGLCKTTFELQGFKNVKMGETLCSEDFPNNHPVGALFGKDFEEAGQIRSDYGQLKWNRKSDSDQDIKLEARISFFSGKKM